MEDPVLESPIFLEQPYMPSPEEFTPEICTQNNREYQFQCPSEGLFQCSITGLVFGMKGQGEVVYRTISWDRSLLAQKGKRPAGPLFNLTCNNGSVCQLHLPHCEIHSGGGDGFLCVAHVTADDNVEIVQPYRITETHVVINISGFSAYGNVNGEDDPICPINGLLMLFYEPFVLEKRSILNVLLLPSNVVRKEVREVIERDGIREILTTSQCKLTPKQEYTLCTDPECGYRIKPKKAEFVKFDSYENYYYPTFQLFLQTVVKEVDLLLTENESHEHVWDGTVWFPATTSKVTSTGTTIKVSVQLLDTLEELKLKELMKFQWHLTTGVNGFQSIPKSKLENTDLTATVDMMVQTYCDDAVKITLTILGKMKLNHLAKSLEQKMCSEV
ncbi:hypothetical protein UPYG_G00054240 [Umbra pygmaea]|uniref:FIIND domain-containing protein n=1 Tax=Umbra pygmaea TaxID=75934 RepID=A0ABD0XXD7_UMBPY